MAGPERRIRILLAEDQSLTRAGLRSLLEQCADLEVVGEVADIRRRWRHAWRPARTWW